jgi:hypothetical protein
MDLSCLGKVGERNLQVTLSYGIPTRRSDSLRGCSTNSRAWGECGGDLSRRLPTSEPTPRCHVPIFARP